MRKFALFCRPFWHEKTHKNAQKRAKLRKNAPFCTDACNIPVYYTPISVHPKLTKPLPQSSSKGIFFVRVRFGGVPSTVEEVVWVRFCCLPSWKTNMGNTGRTVLGHRPIPSNTRILRQIAPESSPKSSAKSLSHKFFGVPVLALKKPNTLMCLNPALPFLRCSVLPRRTSKDFLPLSNA